MDKVDDSGNFTVIIVSGEVDLYTVQFLERHIERVGASKNGVLIDLRSVALFSAAGYGWLIRMLKSAKNAGKCLRVKACREGSVGRVLKIAGFEQLVKVEYNHS